MTVIKRLVSIALAAGALAWGGAAVAQPADFKAQADALVSAAYAQDGPGAAVVVTRGGRVVYSTGRGLSDLEARRPITPDTVFKTGSITKQFVAAVVLQLVAEGRLSLDDPISRFFPDYPQPGARATVRQLLNHSSGIQDHSKIAGWMGTEATARPHTTAELVAVISERPAPSEPGARWEYNNGGYTLLGAIVEKITGKPWYEAVDERIAGPLGLTTLSYGGVKESDPMRARGYALEDGEWGPARPAHISVAHAAGGLVISPLDMAKWAQALHHGRVVPPALYQEMIRPARLNDGSTQPYGFGLRLRQFRGRAALIHGGAARGVDTESIYIPSDDLFVAVFANSDTLPIETGGLAIRMAGLALGEPFPNLTRADVPAGTIEPLLGSYRAESGPAMRFVSRDGRYFLGRGDEEIEVFPAGDDRFFPGPNDPMWLRFVRRPDGAHVMERHGIAVSAPATAVRTGAPPAAFSVDPAVLRSYVGVYTTENPVLTVAMDPSGRLTIAPAGQEPMTLRPVSPVEFHLDEDGMRVVFYPENGAVDRLTLHRGARVLNGRRTSPSP